MSNRAIERYLKNLGIDNSNGIYFVEDNGKGVEIIQWNCEHPKPTKKILDKIQKVLNKEAIDNKYQMNRLAEYPPIEEQLDALWKGGAEAEAMKAIIDGIKEKYPKGKK